MMYEFEPAYIQRNRHVVERLLILLQRRRLLREDRVREDYEECRKSAHGLRKALEAEMLLVQNGPLMGSLRDMQTVCTNFVSAAGHKSSVYKQDHELFEHQLEVLREVFATRISELVDAFSLPVTPELQAVMLNRG